MLKTSGVSTGPFGLSKTLKPVGTTFSSARIHLSSIRKWTKFKFLCDFSLLFCKGPVCYIFPSYKKFCPQNLNFIHYSKISKRLVAIPHQTLQLPSHFKLFMIAPQIPSHMKQFGFKVPFPLIQKYEPVVVYNSNFHVVPMGHNQRREKDQIFISIVLIHRIHHALLQGLGVRQFDISRVKLMLTLQKVQCIEDLTFYTS